MKTEDEVKEMIRIFKNMNAMIDRIISIETSKMISHKKLEIEKELNDSCIQIMEWVIS